MKNDPPGHLAEANVIGAWATLSFRREGTEIRQATGVWYKESQRVFTAPLNLPTPPTSAVAGRRDLMADGSEHALDIVFIPYGWDGPPMFWQEEGVALPLESDDRYDILVTLGGQGLPTTTVSLVLEQGEAGHWTVRKVGEGLT